MKTTSLSKIFNQAIFRIPDYQRGYSWSVKQLNQFWGDIQRLRPDQEHYTGLLTVEEALDVHRNDKWNDVQWIIDDSDYRPFYVVDGQQRLTTIVILIQAIIENIKDDQKLNLKTRDQIREQFICIKNEHLKAFLFGYERDDPSYEYLKTQIFQEHSSDSLNTPLSLYTHNLETAKTYFQEVVSELSMPQLEELYKKVSLRLKFNLYEVDNDLDVFVMFETMNNRGKPLTKLELLKNRLIYLSTLLDENSEIERGEIRRKINSSWKTIYEYLGKNREQPLDDDEFLKNHTYMYFGYMDDKSDLYAEFLLDKHFTAKHIYSNELTIRDLRKYVESIQLAVVKWFDIKFPTSEVCGLDDDVRLWLSRLSRLRHAYFLPAILGALVLRSAGGHQYSSDQIVRLLQSMEKFAFVSFSVFQRNANYKKNYFLSQAKDICHGKQSISDLVLSIDDAAKQQSNSIDSFKYQLDRLFDNENKPGFYGWNGIHYLLFEFETHLKGGEDEKVTWDVANHSRSIEHIFPTDPNEEWEQDFGIFTEGQKKMLCNSLGNLLLISQKKNSSLKNRGFQYKKSHTLDGVASGYFNGSHSEIDVAQYSQWTEREILSRGIRMLEFMETRWEIFIGEDKKRELLFLDFLSSD